MQVKVLDASWYLKTMNKDARAEFSARRIPGCDPNHYFKQPNLSIWSHRLGEARLFLALKLTDLYHEPSMST
jgi:hypothetical protein